MVMMGEMSLDYWDMLSEKKNEQDEAQIDGMKQEVDLKA